MPREIIDLSVARTGAAATDRVYVPGPVLHIVQLTTGANFEVVVDDDVVPITSPRALQFRDCREKIGTIYIRNSAQPGAQALLYWSADIILGKADGPVPHTHDGADITAGLIGTARLGAGAANAGVFLRGDQTWAAAAGGGAGSVLGYARLTHAAQQAVNAPTGANGADVNAALAVAFNAPASGKVLVTLEAVGSLNLGGVGSVELMWGVREGAADVAGSYHKILHAQLPNSNDQPRCTVHAIIEGLASGSAHTYKFGHRMITSVGGDTADTMYGGLIGYALIMVTAL